MEPSRSSRRSLSTHSRTWALAWPVLLALEASDASAQVCVEQTLSVEAEADSWLDEDSPNTNKGSDAILDVDGGDLNPDTGLTSGRARALLRFALPSEVPEGCVVASAKLQLYAPSASADTRAEALRIAAAWSEGSVTWSNQPATVGPAAVAWSTDGTMQWNVTTQVVEMLAGDDHGLLVRDADEASEEGGGAYSFHSSENGDSETLPELVIRFAPPPSGEPPPPALPTPVSVQCGQTLTQSSLVTNDLSDCPGDGLVIGAERIIVDLDEHTIDGVGLGIGIHNDGYASVTVRNGTVREFDHGVRLGPETALNLLEGLTLEGNREAAVELFTAGRVVDGQNVGNEIRTSLVQGNADGIALVSGTLGTLVADCVAIANGGPGLLLRDTHANRLERNGVSGGGDLGIELLRAHGNVLLDNVVSQNSDGGIEIEEGSDDNRIEGNHVTESGDAGILVSGSDGNELISNVSWLMSDSGITLDEANDGVVRGNDVRFNSGGLQVDDSSGNLIEANDASETTGIGIELGGDSFGNHLLLNTANENGSQGIYVGDEALVEPGNLLDRNTTSGNLSGGIVVAKGGHTLVANVANDNGGWGIEAAAGSVDGSLNVATGNGQSAQCLGVVCKPEWDPPETTILSGPVPVTPTRTATFSFSASEPGATFACSLDGGAFASCTSPQQYSGLALGEHDFRVHASDAFGNTDPTPALHEWRIVRRACGQGGEVGILVLAWAFVRRLRSAGGSAS